MAEINRIPKRWINQPNGVAGLDAMRRVTATSMTRSAPKVRRYVQPEHYLLLHPLDNLTAISTQYSATPVLDTTNSFCGNGGIKIAGNGEKLDCRLNIPLSESVDMTGAVIHVDLYLHPGEGTASERNLSYVQVNLYTSESPGVNGLSHRLMYLGTPAGSPAGWHRWACAVSEFGTLIGEGADISDINCIRVAPAWTTTTATTAVTVDRLAVVHMGSTPSAWLLRTDGSRLGAIEIARYLRKKGLSASFGLSVSDIGNEDMISWTQARDLNRMGMDVSAYVGSAPGYAWTAWSQQTDAAKLARLDYVYQTYAENGMPNNAAYQIMIPGGGGWLPSDEHLLAGRYTLIGGNNTGSGTHPICSLVHIERGVFPWTGFIDTGPGTVPVWLADAIAVAEGTPGSVLVLGTHYATTDQISACKAAIDALADSSLKCVTLHDLATGAWL
ncbi:MAG: hypothetical protein GXY83_15660 [Rhodopirellula sp.]|nr:hypothetical protein [Rhodopirellula sp.]